MLKIMDMIPKTTPVIDNALLSSLSLIPVTPITIANIPRTTPIIGMKPAIPNAKEYAPFL